MEFFKKLIRDGDIVLFYVYFWQIPFAWRYILIPNRGAVPPTFNEYMDVSLYIGEVLLFTAFLINLYNNKILEKSIKYIKNKGIQYAKLFHVEHIFVTSIFLFIVINLFFSVDQLITLTTLVHIGVILMTIYLSWSFFVSRGTKFLIELGKILILILLFQFGVALYQAFTSHSLGVYFLNESKIGLNQINIAKSQIFNTTILRSYGTFPHPNILAAFAIFSLFSFHYLSQLFHVERKVLIFVSTLSFFIITLTQSKIGILMFFAVFFLCTIRKKMFHVEQVKFFLLLIPSLIAVTLIFQADIQKSLSARLDQYKVQSSSLDISVFGTGLGTYRLSYDQWSNHVNWWLYEPVHNVPYILFVETGFVGILLIGILIIIVILRVPRGTLVKMRLPIVVLFYLLMTDHFVWDIYQGQQIIALAVSLSIIRFNNIDKLV